MTHEALEADFQEACEAVALDLMCIHRQDELLAQMEAAQEAK